jgi:curved DNA-binding protein
MTVWSLCRSRTAAMTQKTVKDYYAVLGVSQHASLEEIRLAYRRCARAFHPDLSTDPDAEARFREVNEAYEVLANAEKRRAYDYFTTGPSWKEERWRSVGA